MSRVLIFGAGGFVGSYLCKEFLNNGYKVSGTDKGEGSALPSEVDFYKTDLMQADEVKKLIGQIQPDIIVNLAAISSVGASWNMPQTTMAINVIGALNIMEAARKSEQKPRILFVGSSEEYVISENPLDGISKVTQEQLAKLYREQYGLKIYCVRPFNHTGIGQRDTFVLPSFCKQVAEIDKSGKDGKIQVGNLKVKRDFSHVKDVVRAYRMIYNVGSGNAYSLEDMLTYIIGLSDQNIEIEVDQNRIRPTDQPVICCDRSLIGKELGWEPQYNVYDALREMYESYRNGGEN